MDGGIWFMKKILIITILVCLVIGFQFAESFQTGVVQFEEKNNIGLDNAGVIVPEVLVSYLKGIGEYNLSERVLLTKVLEEQSLQMTGIIDETSAGEVGQLFGLGAIITGSIMKIGNEISISGRAIKTESGEIIASGTVKLNDLKELEESLEKLAYLLSGFTEDDYKKISLTQEISRNSYGVRIGSGYAQNHNDSGYSGLLLSLFYQGKYFGAEFNGIPPILGNTAMINPFLSYYPFTHIGFGTGFIFCSDELSMADKDKIGEDHWHGEYVSLLFGINLRITDALRGSLYMGPTMNTHITYQDEDNMDHEYVGGFQFGFPPPAITLDIEYWFPNDLSLRLMFIMDSGTGQLEEGTYEEGMSTSYLLLAVGYKFSL